MNLLQTIWSVLTTPNMQMANFLTSPFIIIEAWVSMLLFITIMNITTSKSQKIAYVAILSIAGFITRFLIPAPFGNIVNMILIPFIISFIFKIGIGKSIICELIPFSLCAILDTFILKFYSSLFDINYSVLVSTPLHKILCSILIYGILFICYFLAKHFNFNINILDNMTRQNKSVLVFNSVFAIIAIGSQFYIAYAYLDKLPVSLVLLSLLSLIFYIFISLYNLTNTTKLEIANRDLEETKMYNKTLSILYDNIRAFKHDFANIVQTIGRLCNY